MYSVLIVEDTREIYENLCMRLDKEGFSTDVATTQKDATDKLENLQNSYDIALVDLKLPDGYGLSIIEIANERKIPVIILTAVDDEYNTSTAINMGAFNYIEKPYKTKVLLAYINSALRWSGKIQTELRCGDLRLDIEKSVAYKGDQDLYLTRIEFRILLVLMRNPGQIIMRQRLLREIWDASEQWITDNTLSVHINRLRQKIETDMNNPQYIQTIRGMGYKMEKK